MSHEPGIIRPRRRQRFDVVESGAAVRAERSTRVLIRVPLATVDPTPNTQTTAPQRKSSSQAGAVTTGHKVATNSTIAASNTTNQVELGSTSPAITHSTVPSTSKEPRELVARLPQESKQYWRIDAAHTTTASPHSPVPSSLERRATALIRMLERKSLLAIGMIVAAAAIAATVMMLTNRSHQNAGLVEQTQSENSSAHPVKETNQHPSLPAPPRATSGMGSPITQPAAGNSIGRGPELTPPGTAPVNSGLPTAVLGTTLNNQLPATRNETVAAANLPAAISASANSNVANASGTHPAAGNNQTPVMAEYRWPQPAVPSTGNPGMYQNGFGPGAGSVAGSAAATTAPILEARRETLPTINTGDSRLGFGTSAAAAFDGGIGKPTEQLPR